MPYNTTLRAKSIYKLFGTVIFIGVSRQEHESVLAHHSQAGLAPALIMNPSTPIGANPTYSFAPIFYTQP